VSHEYVSLVWGHAIGTFFGVKPVAVGSAERVYDVEVLNRVVAAQHQPLSVLEPAKYFWVQSG
jgi:hypothetical protein